MDVIIINGYHISSMIYFCIDYQMYSWQACKPELTELLVHAKVNHWTSDNYYCIETIDFLHTESWMKTK